ncbi:MAG TPA: hypothetical protein VFX29_06635, partial [Longimicrobiaceae bacterium]|nr:hypothetical protein [Longimicrobiaceae bacterium]
LRERVGDLRLLGEAGVLRTRYHGDYHLGQLLRTAGARPGVAGEWVIIDFEGEPARPLAERRAKASPLRDVAGMLRSFDYAVQMALDEQPPAPAHGATLDEWAAAWQRDVRALFLEEWRAAVEGSGIAPEDPAELARVLAALELEKAVYEVGYELNNRPEWIWVPARAIRRLMGGSA